MLLHNPTADAIACSNLRDKQDAADECPLFEDEIGQYDAKSGHSTTVVGWPPSAVVFFIRDCEAVEIWQNDGGQIDQGFLLAGMKEIFSLPIVASKRVSCDRVRYH